MGNEGRGLTSAFKDIHRMVSQLGLPESAREEASAIYRGAFHEGLVQGRSMEGVASAALYVACRMDRIPRTLEEVSEVSMVGKGRVRKTYRKLSKNLNLDLPPVDPALYVSRFGGKLGLSEEIRTQALGLVRRVREANLTSGKSPPGVAAAAIYVAARLNGGRVSQKEAAESAGVTEVTVHKRFHEMVDKLELDVATSSKLRRNSSSDNERSGSGPSAESGGHASEGGDRPERSGNAPLGDWLEKNLYLYKVLSGIEESPRCYEKLALDMKISCPGMEKRVHELEEKGLVRVEDGKVEATGAGKHVLDQITSRLSRDGNGNPVVVE